MRYVLALICLASPAAAWEFTPGLPCLLTHEEQGLAIELTHDPRQPLFTITLTAPTPWPMGDVFSIRFIGAAGLTISTNRHVLSADGRALTVSDTGFGNVLAGLSLNATAEAQIGSETARFDLSGAADPVALFSICAAEPAV
jgi:hypothetical protein